MVDTEHMSVLLTVGEFSRMTQLSVKALRHYDDVGLLSPRRSTVPAVRSAGPIRAGAIPATRT
jgi:MerR-like DNA binding protein